MNRWPRQQIPRIDWSNPLARGLVSCITVVGSRIVDLANPARTFTNAGKSAGRGLKGRHVQATMSGGEHLIPSPAIPTGSGNWTYHVLSRFPANAGNASMVAANPSGAYWSFGYVSGGELVVWSGGGSGFSPSLIPPSSGWAVLSVSGNAAANQMRGIMDNGAVSTLAKTIAQDMTSLLGDSSTSSRGWPDTAVMLIYNRTQSDAEMRLLQRDIWQIFEPVKRTIPLAAPAALNFYTLSADAGSVAITGSPAALRVSRKLPAAGGSLILTGSAAGLRASRRLPAAAGAVALTGSSAGLKASRRLAAGAGSLTLSGSAAGLLVSRRLSAAAGSFVISGSAAAMKVSRRLSAGAGSLSIAGSPARLTVARRLAAGAGSLALTGADVTFSIQGQLVLSADAGAITLTGGAASLRLSRKLGASGGAISLSGGAASLRLSRRLDAQPGALALTGSAAALLVARHLQASGGTIVLTGGEVVFRPDAGNDFAVRPDRKITGYARVRVIAGYERVRSIGAR